MSDRIERYAYEYWSERVPEDVCKGTDHWDKAIAFSGAISLKRIADALERQNDLTAQLWLQQGKQETGPKK